MHFSKRTMAWVEQVIGNPDPTLMDNFSQLMKVIYQYPLAHPDESMEHIKEAVIPQLATEYGIILDEETDRGEKAGDDEEAAGDDEEAAGDDEEAAGDEEAADEEEAAASKKNKKKRGKANGPRQSSKSKKSKKKSKK
jgi:hypothetical protein